MKGKEALARGLVTLRGHLYTGTFKVVLQALGLEPRLVSVYHRLLYLTTSGVTTVSIGGRDAQFHVSTTWESALLGNLMEASVIKDFLSELEPDDIVFDIGANVGLYTCFAGTVLPKGKVVAFEPHPGNVDRMKQNLELNGANAEIHELALSNTVDQTTMPLNSTEPGAVGYMKDENEYGNELDVQTVPAADLVADGTVPSPDVAKIDVIGAEYTVLDGMTRLLTDNHPRVLYCEVYPERLPDFGATAETVNDLLRKHDYRVERIHEVEKAHYIKATSPDADT